MRPLIAALVVACLTAWPLRGATQPVTATPSPSASPSASPSPSPSPSPFVTPSPAASATPPAGRVAWSNMLVTNGASSAVSGPGASPPEAEAFVNGSPIAPGTPYDFFTSGIATNGVGVGVQLRGSAVYATPTGWHAQIGYGVAALQGGANTIGYWNQPFFAPLDPHFSGSRLALPVAFPTHAGQDDTAGIAAALTDVHLSFDRGGWWLNAGVIQPAQTLRFVFAPPPNAVVSLGVMPALAETLTGGPPALDAWNQLDPAIPLRGVELIKSFGASTNLVLDDAGLPSLPGTQTRVTSASLQVDRGNSNVFGLQVVHARESGNPILAGVFYGANPQLSDGAQGNLPTSTLFSQDQTIVGVRQALHRGRDYGLIEIGRSWYAANPVERPSSQSGGYYHLAFAHDFGAGTAQIDAYRFEPRYAQMVLPYGTPENVWSVAWSWPGPWLKSDYQLVDNSQIGINRQGLRFKWNGTAGNVQYGISVSQFHQVEAITSANARSEGFVDGFYLPETGAGTIGEQAQGAAYATWHLPFLDLTADAVDDAFHRAGTIVRDAVSYDVPQYILSVSKTTDSTVVALGFGRYGMLGSWANATSNVDIAQRQLFAGVETKLPRSQMLLIEVRRLLTAGVSATPGVPANANGTVLVVEDRLSL